MNYFLRLLPYFLLGSCWIGNITGGPWTLAGPIIVFILHPLLDNIIQGKMKNDDGPGAAKFLNLTLYFLPLAITGYLIHGLILFPLMETTFEKMSLIISLGTGTGGLGIIAAHELVHRSRNWQRGLGVFLLALVNYTYFRIEHVYGHHRMVSTPEDPASARFGESLYTFLPGTLIGSIRNAWKLESKRLGKKNTIIRLLENRMIHYIAISFALSALVFYFFKSSGFFLFWGQSLFAIFLSETINYVEHYGLEREKLPDGRYEPVREWHSWDSDYAITNFSLFNIGKHSHHHTKASVEFPYLVNRPDNPKLPFGYSSAVILATIPPLWKKIMDPQILKRRESFQHDV